MSRRIRAIALIALAAILAWQVVTRSLAAHFAASAPETALMLRPTEPKALLTLAEKRIAADYAARASQQPGATAPKPAAQAKTGPGEASDRLRLWAELAFKTIDKRPEDARPADKPSGQSAPPPAPGLDRQTAEQVRAWAELALGNDPLNARALRILGQVADGARDEERVAKFMRAAARGSIRESAAVYWLMRKSYEKGDYAATIHWADVLLRTRSQIGQYVMPTLVRLSEYRNASDELKKVLANNPPWRSAFLAAIASGGSDPRTPLEFLLALREGADPPSANDLRTYLNAMIGRKQYELAYYAWLQFLPPEHLTSAGLLFNGSFEAAPSGMPFDWVFGSGSGVTVDVAPRPDKDGQHALLIDFGHGRVEFGGVRQLVMLAPGTYEFKGKYKGEVVGKRGLVWRIACAPSNAPLGESPMTVGVTPKWRDIEFSFTVPDTDCRAQVLQLVLDARMPSELLVSGSIWHDELRISPVR